MLLVRHDFLYDIEEIIDIGTLAMLIKQVGDFRKILFFCGKMMFAYMQICEMMRYIWLS